MTGTQNHDFFIDCLHCRAQKLLNSCINLFPSYREALLKMPCNVAKQPRDQMQPWELQLSSFQ